jgi:hypothetical protein
VICQAALVALDRLGDQGQLDVGLAQAQIVHGQFALHRQPGAGQVGRAGLGGGLGPVDPLADAAPQVGLPAGADAGLVAVALPEPPAELTEAEPPARVAEPDRSTVGNRPARCSRTMARAWR